MKISLKRAIILYILIGLIILFAIVIPKNDHIIGTVVANAENCAIIGRDMLNKGGSAVDAAIATMLCDGVMMPFYLGIGGGFSATIYSKSNRKIETLIARESAPASATEQMFESSEALEHNPKAGAVPGEILGYWEMHQKYGILPWKFLFQPVIKMCETGHYVSSNLETAIALHENIIRNRSELAAIFITTDGELYKEGDFIKRPQLAVTLSKIAEQGADALYGGGELAQIFVEDLQKLGSDITVQDLRNYRVQWDDTQYAMANISTEYTLYTTPLPSSGVLLAFILNVLSDWHKREQPVFWHRTIEAFKHAYGQRSLLGDSRMETTEMAAQINTTYRRLFSKDFIREIRTKIKDQQTFADPAYYGAKYANRFDNGTASVLVLAPNGDAISVTASLNNYFGCKLCSPRTGIILNDAMADFSLPGMPNAFGLPPAIPNYIKPGKRPMSSMCPAIILDRQGNVRLLVSAAGTSRITTAVATTIIKYLLLNESLIESVYGGRTHHELEPMLVNVESDVDIKVLKYLERVGHKLNIKDKSVYFGVVTAVGARSAQPKPITDRRRKGNPAIASISCSLFQYLV